MPPTPSPRPPRPRASSRSGIPDPFIDEVTEPVDTGMMEAAARLSLSVPDPDQVAHTVRRASGSSPDGTLLPFAEVRIAGVRGTIRLPARNVGATGVALEVPTGVTLAISDGVAASVDLHLGSDRDGRPIHSRLAATVAHYRQPGGKVPGGLSLRWETRSPGAAEALAVLLERLSAPAR